MLNPQGYATIIDPDRGLIEFDAVTCAHCGNVSMTRSTVNSTPQITVYKADGTNYEKDAGFCRACFHYICPICDGKPCSNRFKRLDEEEKVARSLIWN